MISWMHITFGLKVLREVFQSCTSGFSRKRQLAAITRLPEDQIAKGVERIKDGKRLWSEPSEMKNALLEHFQKHFSKRKRFWSVVS
ncbi:hypothetical protein V6N13_090709 [Hibiscus sabdariffa]